MIIVHIDTTTDGHTLVDCYKDMKDTDTLLVNPTEEELIKVLNEKPDNETIMCLGHGGGWGLFGAQSGYIIGEKTLPYLKNREMICVWCHAKDFGKRFGLKGFFTSMFVSNPGEARAFNFKPTEESVTQRENTTFAKKVNNLIKTNVPLNEWIDNLQDYNKDLDFVCFNYENLEYLDGTQKPQWPWYLSNQSFTNISWI